MPAPVYLPAALVTTATAVPRCCTRHGRPEEVRRRVRFLSRTPPWVYVTILAGLGVTLIIMIAIRKQVDAPAWPFCRACLQERAGWLRLAWGSISVLLGIAVLPPLLAPDAFDLAGASVLIFTGLFLAPLLGLAFGTRGTWATLAGGVVDHDGWIVRFERPAGTFVATLPPPPVAVPQPW